MITPGNIHDSVAFDEVNDCPMEAFLEVESIAMDSAYERPHICKRYLEVGMCCPQYISGHKREREMYGEIIYMIGTITM